MRSYTSEFSVGGDPEFFLMKDGIPTSAHSLLPGTKEEPHKLKHGAVQVDGMAVEFNIDPAKSSTEFAHNINETILEIRKMVPKEYKFHYAPTVTFKENDLKIIPDANKELGCSPDWNAYSGLQNQNPKEALARIPFTRSAGGHICIGWGENLDKKDESHLWDCRQFIKTVDTLYSYNKHFWDTDSIRATLYGKPGAFRPTSFGVEYRTPSNAWIKYPKMYEYMFGLMSTTMEGLLRGTGEFRPPHYKTDLLKTIRND